MASVSNLHGRIARKLMKELFDTKIYFFELSFTHKNCKKVNDLYSQSSNIVESNVQKQAGTNSYYFCKLIVFSIKKNGFHSENVEQCLNTIFFCVSKVFVFTRVNNVKETLKFMLRAQFFFILSFWRRKKVFCYFVYNLLQHT